MFNRRLFLWFIGAVILFVSVVPARAYIAYETRTQFCELMTRDLLNILPRAMGSYLYQNRYDFLRGITFMTRNVMTNPLKNKDMEEIRREAYERLMRDIPYCVEAFKGGELKLDSSPGNLAGRLGMIAYSITLLSMPAFPELDHLERFSRLMEEILVESQIDILVYYDGYGDFQCLGELMERLRPQEMPAFRHVRNDKFPGEFKDDAYALFRFPDKYDRHFVMTSVDVNQVYNTLVNNIADAFIYIWKCSGMELRHPSYAAPPGTIINRPNRRILVSGGVLSRPIPLPKPGQPKEEATEGTGQSQPPYPEGASSEPPAGPGGEQSPNSWEGAEPPSSIWR